MSLQDDYFDLEASLNKWQKQSLNRIWEAFVETEKENELLGAIVYHMRKAMVLIGKVDTQ